MVFSDWICLELEMGMFPNEDEIDKIRFKKEQAKKELEHLVNEDNCEKDQLEDMKKAIR